MTGLSKSYADHLTAEQWASLSNRVYARPRREGGQPRLQGEAPR